MKTLKQLFLRTGLSIVTAILAFQTHAQLPSSFTTKVESLEHTTVSYSMTALNGEPCLTLIEKGLFHGYSHLMQKDEYIDEEGLYYLDQTVLEETDVRDEWISSHKRMILDPEKVEFFDANNELIYSTSTSEENAINAYTEDEANDFGQYEFNATSYTEMKSDLLEDGFTLLEQNGILTATAALTTILFDSANHIFTTQTFNDAGFKIKQTAIQFSTNSYNQYFPETETTYEWFLTKNGCCIRKETIITRFNYLKSSEANSAFEQEKTGISSNSNQYTILVQENSDQFSISHPELKGKPIQISIYNLSGKLIHQATIIEGNLNQLPKDSRWGMYIIHIQSQDQTKPSVGKIIHTNRTPKF